jgi:hypothetical protein
VTGGWRKLHKEELHNLHASPGIIRMFKSGRIILAGHVAQMGRRGIYEVICGEARKEKDH